MSFTAEVKEQLLRINTSKRCCREAEFLAFLRIGGRRPGRDFGGQRQRGHCPTLL